MQIPGVKIGSEKIVCLTHRLSIVFHSNLLLGVAGGINEWW